MTRNLLAYFACIFVIGRVFAADVPPDLELPRADAPVSRGDLPDKAKTPGEARPELTKEKICSKDFHTNDIRDVSESLKQQVYQSYGMAKDKAPCPCEVDHLISLELGGANTAKNLWPQSYITKPWNAHVKDVLENKLHRDVCAGLLSLEEAQKAISDDWIAAYRKWQPTKLNFNP